MNADGHGSGAWIRSAASALIRVHPCRSGQIAKETGAAIKQRLVDLRKQVAPDGTTGDETP